MYWVQLPPNEVVSVGGVATLDDSPAYLDCVQFLEESFWKCDFTSWSLDYCIAVELLFFFFFFKVAVSDWGHLMS